MKILLGMSGGIDSTYAALKLIEQGHTVEGAVLIMHKYTEADAAVSAAESVGIPIHKVDCRRKFEQTVVQNFINEYSRGRTPNPCTLCNSEVKFKYLLEYALANGFDMIATGHYAKIEKNGDRYAVYCSADSAKDQTYMLWRLGQDVLSHLCLPLWNDEKVKIREHTKKIGLIAADRADSQEICFIPDGDYAAYIEKRTKPSEKGLFISPNGEILGEHNGIIRYTVGQRKGLGIAFGKRVFVTDINSESNTITLSEEDIRKEEFSVSGINFSGIGEMKIGGEISLSVKVRYQAPAVPCTLLYLGEGQGRVFLEKPQRAITPGQCAVFYLENMLALGGYID